MAGIRAGRVTVKCYEDELTDLEAGRGASGSGRNLYDNQLHQQKYAPPPAVLVGGFGGGRNFYGRRTVGSYRSMGSFSSPRSGGGIGRFFHDPRCEDDGRGYFLDACALCKKSLSGNHDIFMYRGDTPFCSEECRQDQIEMDEAKEKNLRNVAVKASSSKEPKTNTTQDTIHVQAVGATVAG